MSPPRPCPKCGLFTDHVSGPLPVGRSERCPYDRLREAVGVEVSPAEDRSLHWLASTDWTTVDTLEALFRRLRGAGDRASDARKSVR